MMQMDEIVTVDTAAAHLAGAIGHPNVTLMLSQWHSWRWHNNPFYPHVRIVESGR
jgi:ADP-heptose:LPS heptosyltransferase